MADNTKQVSEGNKESKAKGCGGMYSEQQREKRLAVLTPIISVILALLVGAIIIACLGKNPIQGYGAMLQGSLGVVGRWKETYSLKPAPKAPVAVTKKEATARRPQIVATSAQPRARSQPKDRLLVSPCDVALFSVSAISG